MLTLVVVIIILGALIVAVAGFCLRRLPQRSEASPDAADEVTQPLAALSLSLAFDPEYAILWDTQVPALELIAAGKDAGVSLDQLYVAHGKLARCYPELYEGSTLEQWLDLLQEARLITRRADRVKLAPQGRDFLRFRVTLPLMKKLEAGKKQ